MPDENFGVRVYLLSNPELGGLDVWVTRREHGKSFIARPIKFEFVEGEPGFESGPTFRLYDEFAIAGILKAQSYDLEDLRKLLKLDKQGRKDGGKDAGNPS